MRCFLAALIILVASTAHGQWIASGSPCVVGRPYPYGPTDYGLGAGLYLSGAANLIRAQGQYIQDRQNAIEHGISNHAYWLRTKWALQDEARARQRAKYPSPLDRQEQRLKNAERSYALKQKEAELIEKGILPKPPEPSFTHNGVKYKSYSEFRNSEAFNQMIADRIADEAIEFEKKLEADAWHRFAVEFQRKWDKMSYSERQRYIIHRRSAEIMKEPASEKSAEDFYNTRPYLIPRAGQNGLPPLPKSLEWKLEAYKELAKPIS